MAGENLRLQFVSNLCRTDQKLKHFEPLYQDDLSLAYVESVAVVRFIVLAICEWVIEKFDLKREALNILLDQEDTIQRIEQKKAQLVINFKQVFQYFDDLSQSVKCSERLHLFFIKALYSQLGWGGMQSILLIEELKGMIPSKCYQLGKVSF